MEQFRIQCDSDGEWAHASARLDPPPASCTAEATHLRNGVWYLNRVVVPRTHRRRGWGSRLVRELQEKLQLHREFRSLGVVLGGYDLRMEEQSSFFRKLGFEPLLPCPESPLMWPRVDPSVLRGTLFDLQGT